MYVVLVILVLLMPVPLYIGFMSLFKDKHRQKSLLAVKTGFKRLVKRHALSVSDAVVYSDRLIAMDKKAGKLVLVIYKNGITWEKCVDTGEIVSYQVEKKMSKVNGRIQKVNLQLTCRNDEIITFSFFDEEVDDPRDLSLRLKKAQHWEKKIGYRLIKFQSKETNQTPRLILHSS